MARSKKADEQKQLAPAVQPHLQQQPINGPGPAPIMAPPTPFSNQQGRVIDVGNFIRVRDSVRAHSVFLTLLTQPTHPPTPFHPRFPAPSSQLPLPSTSTTFPTLTAAAATCTAPPSVPPSLSAIHPRHYVSTPEHFFNNRLNRPICPYFHFVPLHIISLSRCPFSGGHLAT